LVTGGAGYIGGTTVRLLLEQGYRITVLDDLRQGRAESIPDDVRFVEGSIADGDAVRDAIGDGMDACLHFASSTEAGESMRHASAFFANNTAGTLLLLEGLIAGGVHRFVMSSTAAVYGDPERVPIEEDDPKHPTNAYGATKLAVEGVLDWLGRAHRLRSACLRYFNAAGAIPGHGEIHRPETHLVPRLLRVASGDEPFATIFGDRYETPDGTCIRDYVHVQDLAHAHILALQALDDHPSLVCNLGLGRGFSVREVVGAVERVTGAEVPVRIMPPRLGDPPRLVASADRARSVLGWSPRWTALDEIVASAWDWHREAARAAMIPGSEGG
jgi:UDP-glucose 4-epimerase